MRADPCEKRRPFVGLQWERTEKRALRARTCKRALDYALRSAKKYAQKTKGETA